MNDFLWSQAASREEPDLFVIDGELSHYSGNVLQNKAMEFMSSLGKKYDIRHSESDSTSLAFYIKSNKEKKLWQLSGNFKEKDEVGRNLVYVFTTKQSEFEKIIETLKRYSEMLNLSLYETDVEKFRLFFLKNKRKKKLIPILIVLITLIGLILAFCNK